MARMNWSRVNSENRAIREADRFFEPEPVKPGKQRTKAKTNKKKRAKRKRMTEKERALIWHRQNRPTP